jgi:hypothetical protein
MKKPYPSEPMRPLFIPRELLLEALKDVPPIDGARFRRDIDAILDQDIEPRT